MNIINFIKRLPLYYSTARYLKCSQLMWYVYRRYIQNNKAAINVPEAIYLRSGIKMLKSVGHVVADTEPGVFCFLGIEQSFTDAQIDWRSNKQAKLWRYNLHYFDYMRNDSWSVEYRLEIINDWIKNNPIGSEDAWEPYTVSLRIVNWIKFILTNNIETNNASEVLRSLYQQGLWLEKNIEYHILANHYLKNGVALLFLGVFFDGEDANRWGLKGCKILKEQLQEQFLEDGGHYERSPMYHSIAVIDYLDVINICKNSISINNISSVCLGFKNKIISSLNFLQNITMPDGEISLFNDAAFGIAPQPEQIFEYANKIIDFNPVPLSQNFTIQQYDDSGYYVARNNEDMLIFDCGPIGPDYQPGHAHCDTFSYELSLSGKRVIVDTGVFNYEYSWHREYARRTDSHNTVSVDGLEQSEIWSSFRVGKRVKPAIQNIICNSESMHLSVKHDGFYKATDKIQHFRNIDYAKNSTLKINDSIQASTIHNVVSYLHIHPQFTVQQYNNTIKIIDSNDSAIAEVKCANDVEINIGQGWYFPRFNEKLSRPFIALKAADVLPQAISYEIKKMNLV